MCHVSCAMFCIDSVEMMLMLRRFSRGAEEVQVVQVQRWCQGGAVVQWCRDGAEVVQVQR